MLCILQYIPAFHPSSRCPQGHAAILDTDNQILATVDVAGLIGHLVHKDPCCSAVAAAVGF